MSRLTSFQNKIQVKVFDSFGTPVDIASQSSNSTDKWGDASITYNTAVSTVGVPFNLITDNQTFEKFGDLNSGEMDLMLPHTATSISIGDRVTYESVNYTIKQIEKYPFDSGNLAFAVRLVKVI